VPFFLSEYVAARVTGTGEGIAPLAPQQAPVVLVKPRGISISTKWAYAQWDKYASTPHTDGYTNDFEPIVFSTYPVLAEACKKLRSFGACQAGLSGSGSTVFGIFPTAVQAKNAKAAFDPSTFWAWNGWLLH